MFIPNYIATVAKHRAAQNIYYTRKYNNDLRLKFIQFRVAKNSILIVLVVFRLIELRANPCL